MKTLRGPAAIRRIRVFVILCLLPNVTGLRISVGRSDSARLYDVTEPERRGVRRFSSFGLHPSLDDGIADQNVYRGRNVSKDAIGKCDQIERPDVASWVN